MKKREKTIFRAEYKTIIEKMVKARKELGISQAELASRINRPKSYIAKIEIREKRLDIIELYDLSKMLKKPMKYFISELLDS